MKAYYNEIDPFRVGVLKRRIADGSLPKGDVDDRDIRTVSAGDIDGYGQVHLFAGIGGFPLACRIAGWPDEKPILTGGFPCQGFSVAGLRKGISDHRYLWPEVSRILADLKKRPSACLFENVDGITDLALDRVLLDLENLEYPARPYWVPACAVNAPIERMRVWIVALSGALDDTDRPGRGEQGGAFAMAPQHLAAQCSGSGAFDACDLSPGEHGRARRIKSGIRPLAHGVSDRVARLKATGDAIEPHQAALFLRAIQQQNNHPDI